MWRVLLRGKGSAADLEDRICKFEAELKKLDGFKRVQSTVRSGAHWLLAISGASLMWVVTSHGGFTVDGELPFKPLYLAGLLFLGLATLFLGVMNALLFFRAFAHDTVSDRFEQLKKRVHLYDEQSNESSKYQESREKVLGLAELWRATHNLVPQLLPLGVLGISFFVLGLFFEVLFVVFFTAFVR